MAVIQAPSQSRTLPPARDLMAGLAAFAICVIPLLGLKFYNGKFPVDLAVYREAGRVVLHGGNPYAPDFGRDLRIPLPFTYPPFAALLSVTIGVLSKRIAVIVSTTVSLSVLAAMAWAVIRPAFERPGTLTSKLPSWKLAALTGLAAGGLAWTIPVSENIAFGQVNLLLAGACLADCLWTTNNRGVLVGLATAIKLTPGMFILYFAATRQWGAAARAAVTAGLCELLAFAILPGPSRQYWFHLAFSPSRTGDPSYYTNQSIYGAVARLHLWPGLWPLLALGAGALGLCQAARAYRQGQEVMAVALVGMTAVLVSPVAWQHHAVWIVFVAAVLIGWTTTPLRGAVVVGFVGAFIFPFPWVGKTLEVAGRAPGLSQVLENFDLLAFLILLVALPLFVNAPAGG